MVHKRLIHTYHAVPLPYHDHAVLKATSQDHGTAWHANGMGTAWYVWISIGRPETACGRSARVRLLPTTTRSFTKVVTRSRLAVRIFRLLRRTRHCRRTAGSRHGTCELTRQGNGMGTSWYVWISLNSPVTFMYENWTLPSLAAVYAGNSSIDSPHSSAWRIVKSWFYGTCAILSIKVQAVIPAGIYLPLIFIIGTILWFYAQQKRLLDYDRKTTEWQTLFCI
jgi:hypothetical protein